MVDVSRPKITFTSARDRNHEAAVWPRASSAPEEARGRGHSLRSRPHRDDLIESSAQLVDCPCAERRRNALQDALPGWKHRLERAFARSREKEDARSFVTRRTRDAEKARLLE